MCTSASLDQCRNRHLRTLHLVIVRASADMAARPPRRALRAVTFCASPFSGGALIAPHRGSFHVRSSQRALSSVRACAAPDAGTAAGAAKSVAPAPRGSKLVLVGLGNSGAQYDGTRHNVGFAVVSEFVRRNGGGAFRSERRFEAGVAQVCLHERTVHVAQPRTFMNASGRSVRALVQYYDVPRSALLVVSDDMALPLGRVRLRAGGSAGGHNGLRSIEKSLGDRDYARLRVGVGEARNGAAGWKGHVLGRFSRQEMEVVDEVVWDCVELIEEWVREERFGKVVDKLSQIQGRRLGK